MNPRDHCDAVLALLRDSGSYPEPPTRVEEIETHISHVFLAGNRAYKLKKPVQFDFLDFSSTELRRKACQDELRLNRRLAESVYIDVVPVVRTPAGSLRLSEEGSGAGEPVEWIVKMRRLRADRAFDKLLAAGAVDSAAVEAVARKLAGFYHDTAPNSVSPETYRGRIETHVRANRRELLETTHELPASLVKRIHCRQLRLLKLAPQRFDERVRAGRIVDGHGDLRPEHIYLDPEPVVIDCVEFSADLRTVDAADDLAFLAMELDRLGAAAVGERIGQTYRQAARDEIPVNLWSFYKSYRASVRAKVLLLRGDQLPPEQRSALRADVERYLELANRYAAAASRPLCLIARGLSGSGKSTLAAAVAEELGLEHLQTDQVRHELFPSPAETTGYGAGHYTLECRDQVYEAMFGRAQAMMREGLSVVLDGTFLLTNWRAKAADMARRLGADRLVRCDCPPEIAAELAAGRRLAAVAEAAGLGSASDAGAETVRAQIQEDEPDPPGVKSIPIDTTASLPEQLAQLYRELGEERCC